MKEPVFRYVDCLDLRVTDLEEGLRFYRDKLGHELIWKTETKAGLRLPDGRAELVIRTEDYPPEMDIKVNSVEEAVRQFVRAGGEILRGPFDIMIGKCVVVKDPFGNQLTLLDPSKGMLATDKEGNVIGNNPV